MGVTPTDLFRSGNSKHSRLQEVRTAHDPVKQGISVAAPDVDTYVDSGSQEIWVSSATGGGASAWDAPDSGWRKPWRLPAGTAFPDTLRLWNDNNPQGHWTFAPAYDMPLDVFRAELEKVSALFRQHP